MSLEALSKQLGISAGTVSVEEQEINIELNIESDEDGVPVDTTEAPEAQILDAQEGEEELDNTAEAQEELEEAHEALEALAISIESYKATGGLTAQIAEEKYQQLDLITRRWGSLRASCPSVESFGLESSQLDATVSLENTVIDAIKRFWQTIIDTVSKWVADFKAWIVKITNAGTRLTKRAEKVKKMIGDMKQDPSSKDAEGRSAAKVYMKEGSVLEGMSNLREVVYGAFEKNVVQSSKVVEGLLSSIKAADKSGGATEIAAPGLGTIQAMYTGLAGGGFIPAPGGGKYKISKPLPGGVAFGAIDGIQGISSQFKFTSDVNSAKDVKAHVNKFHVAFPAIVGKEALGKAKVKYLNGADAAKVVDKVIEVAKLCEGYKSKFAEREKVSNSITSLAKEQISSIKSSDDKNAQSTGATKTAVQVAQTIQSKITQADKTILSNALTISHKVLDFVVSSVSAGKGEAKEEKKDGE